MVPIMMSPFARDQIKQYLYNELRRYWEETAASAANLTRPFHTGLAPTAMRFWGVASSHSFYTRSGSWWQNIARLVGAEYHPVSLNAHTITGQLSAAAESHISQLIEDMNSGHPRKQPSRNIDTREVLTVQGETGQSRSEISDLYIKRKDGTELYFEIKTPEPNKAHCMQMKQRILTITALRKGIKAEAFGACAYNPYAPDGSGDPYTWNYTPQFLEIGRDWLISRDFWSVIGADTTYGYNI